MENSTNPHTNFHNYCEKKNKENPPSTMLKHEIHLTGAATNPWIRFESDDNFIEFEIGTNWFNLVKFYSTFLLHILHFSTLSIFSGQNLCNLRLHLQFSTFDSKLHFNFKIQLQTEISDSNFNPQFQTSTATSNIDLKHQL